MSEPAQSVVNANPKRTYTINEARKILGIGEATAYRLIKAGEFPVPIIVVGHRKKVSKQQLDDFLAGQSA
jgi:excisionase family DNA binding protein